MFDSIIGQKLLDHNLFAFYLGKNNSESTLTFGWVDKTRYEEPLVWHPVINKYFWSLKLDKVEL
jgi:cathepsin E